MAGVAGILLTALQIYVYCIMVWTLGSWFPQWRFQAWFKTLDSAVSPFVAVFQPLKLQYGGFDFTPLAAMLAVEVFRYMVASVLYRSYG